MMSSLRLMYKQNISAQLLMENSDGSKRLSSETSTDDSFQNDNSDISKSVYLQEPEYMKEELKLMEFSDDTKSNSW